MVRDGGSALTINYANDFKGGVNVGAEGGFRVSGPTSFSGPVSVASGQPVNIRDQYHGMRFNEPQDGPYVYGYGGGALGTRQQADKGGEKVALTWDRNNNVDVKGNLTVGGKPLRDLIPAPPLPPGWGPTGGAGGSFDGNIKGQGVINFGSDQEKQADAGKIGYGTFDGGKDGTLNIVGAGKNGQPRQVQVWESLRATQALGVGDMPRDWTGANFKRRDGRWTNFDWKDDTKNYIRGDTQIDNNVNIDGNFTLKGQPLLNAADYIKIMTREGPDKGSTIIGFGERAKSLDPNNPSAPNVPFIAGGIIRDKKLLALGGDEVKIGGNVDINGNLTIKGQPLATGGAGGGFVDFDAFSNGNDAKFSPGWTVGGESIWDPAIRGPNRTGFAHTDKVDDQPANDRSADIPVPGGMKTGFVFHLPWVNCRHFDIFGVLANGKEVFITRVNAFQNARTENTDGFHDGAAIVPIPRVDRFAFIRLRGVRGRIHYMGTGWSRQLFASGNDNGFVSTQNLVGKLSLTDQPMFIRGEGDVNHVLQYTGVVDGPRLTGCGGGQLNTVCGGEKNKLTWNQRGVFIPANGPDWKAQNNQLCIGPKWCIRAEGNNGEFLVLRDMDALGRGVDRRYAFFQDNNGDIRDVINNGQAITIRSDKNGQQKRLQRSDDEVGRFANNNRGDWERVFIEKL